MHAPIMPYSSFVKNDARWTLLQSTYNCPTHGSNADECHDQWASGCNSASYGFACPACGHISRNVPAASDDAHDNMCCGRMICDADFCYTHGDF